MTVTRVVVMPFDTMVVVVTIVVDTVVLDRVYFPLEVGVIEEGGGGSVDVSLDVVVVGT